MLTDATNELKTSVSEGKSLIAAAVTDKGVQTAADATFQTMATNIGSIVTGSTGYTSLTFRNYSTGAVPTLSTSPTHAGTSSNRTVDISSGSITLYIYYSGSKNNKVTFTFS